MKLSNLALATWAYGSLVLVMVILIAACTYIVYHGGPLITVDFLWLYPAGMPLGVEGGIFPAIIGSILEGLLTASMAGLFNVSFAIAAPKNSEVKENQASYSMQNALTITTQEREIIIDQNGQALSQFKYKITNNTDKPMANIQWISVYVHNRQVVYSQDMQLDLENTLQPKQSLSLNLQIPFAKIEEKYKKVG